MLLQKASRQVLSFLKKTKGVYTKKRYNEIKKFIEETAKELMLKVKDGSEVEGIIKYELDKQKFLLNQAIKGVDISLAFPTEEQVIKAALFTPVVTGMTFQSYLESIQSGFFNIWDSAVRTGFLTSETTDKIVRNVMGSADLSKLDRGAITRLRNSINTNTRTVLQSFASETRKAVYKKNAKSISGYRYLATLDRRTCPICGKLDGKIYKDVDKLPEIPLHYNCRCVLVPVIKGLDSFTDTRPMEGGTTGSGVTYEEWLSKQPASIQQEILGVTRYKMYKEGVKFNSFVQSNKVLTLAELRAKLKN